MLAYDDSQLMRMFAELEPKRRLQALKGAFRREANSIRKAAVNNLRSSGLRTDSDLAKCIRAKVFRRTAGFSVTIATAKGKGYHTTRTGAKKPILIWAEDGTKERKTRTESKFFVRKRKGHSTGRMKIYGFMLKTKAQMSDQVTDSLHEEIRKYTLRIAQKYGCK